MTLCPKCVKENLPTSKFCQHCGASLIPPAPPPQQTSTACPKCGRENPVTAKFCQECGTSLAPPPPPPPPPKSQFCPNCSKENLPTSKFCQQCGTSLAPAPPPQSETRQKQSPEPRIDTGVNEKEESHLRRKSKISTSVGLGLAVIAVALFVFFSMNGSSALTNLGGASPAPVTTTRTAALTPKPTPTPTPIPTPDGKTLAELFGTSSSISSIRYDMLVSGPGIPSMTQKIWLKKNKMRTEATLQGTNTITLIDKDAKTVYAYMPAQNLAMKIPFDPAQVPKSPAEEARSIQNSNPKVVGTATIDGKACSVVEYNSAQVSGKAWIWKDKGIPVRTEVTVGGGKITAEYKNIDFADIPDSMFELPAGAKIM